MSKKFKDIIAIIPARYASTRFPGKPLARLGGKTMIRRVYERVSAVFDAVAVATDDERIFAEVESFRGRVVMTSPGHRSGTDRIYEAYLKLGSPRPIVVNVQGDEPFIACSQLEALAACFGDPATQIASLARPFTGSYHELEDPNTPKVVMDGDMNAMYFSRSVIPYCRGKEKATWTDVTQYYTHVGLYGYRADVLARITSLPQSSLEKAESLEQLRWLQAGYRIRMAVTDAPTIGIDTPADLARAEEMIAGDLNAHGE